MEKLTSTTRDSNMELFRIVSMLLVMIFHIHFISFCDFDNDTLNFEDNPINAYLRLLGTTLTITCVDVFILISGWYGINTKISKIKAFIFQVLFYSFPLYIFFILFCDKVSFSCFFIIHLFLMDDYWFVPTYLMLYIFAPVINQYIKNTNKQQFLFLLLACILMQTIYGWLSTREAGYLEGRSPFSFFILYMIARYLRLYPSFINNLSKKTYLLLYFLFAMINALWAFYAYKYGFEDMINIIFKFSSLFTIIQSICLLLLFSKLKINNKWINWIAVSSFAAFLIHCFPFFNQLIYQRVIVYLHSNYNTPIFILLVSAFIISLYIVSILIDKIRIWLYYKISS